MSTTVGAAGPLTLWSAVPLFYRMESAQDVSTVRHTFWRPSERCLYLSKICLHLECANSLTALVSSDVLITVLIPKICRSSEVQPYYIWLRILGLGWAPTKNIKDHRKKSRM
jgi:hypothetical protein